jgi:TP901 family phage tail tape measure protein
MAIGRPVQAGSAMVKAYLDGTALEAGLNRARAQLASFSMHVMQMGMALGGLSAAMMAPLAAGTKVFADFDREMAMVSTMLDDPARWMGEYTAAVRRMSIEFGESTTTISRGLYEILSATIPPEHALGVLDAAMRSAVGGMTDVATATKVLIAVMNSFNMPANKAREVSDMLFLTVRRGVLTFEQLAMYLGNTTATAAQAGVSIDEMGAALATMTRQGVQADVACTALQNILMAFFRPAADAARVAKRYGIELSLATIQSKGLLGVAKQLEKLPRDVVARIFPNLRAIRGQFPLVSNVAGFEHDLKLMASKSGAAETAFKKVVGNLRLQLNRVIEGIRLIGSVIGEALAGPVKRVVAYLMPLIKYTAQWIQANKELVISFGKWAIIIGTAGASLLALGIAAKFVAVALSGLSGIASLLRFAIALPFRLASGAIGGAFTVLGIFLKALKFLVLTSPFKLLALGAKGLIGSLLALKAAVLPVLIGIFSSPLTAALAGVAIAFVVIQIQLGKTGAVFKWFAGLWSRISTGIKAGWDTIMATAGQTLRGIKNALLEGDIEKAAKILHTGLETIWKEGKVALIAVWEEVKEYFIGSFLSAWNSGISVMLDGIYAVRNAANWFGKFLDQGLTGFKAVWDVRVEDQRLINEEEDIKRKYANDPVMRDRQLQNARYKSQQNQYAIAAGAQISMDVAEDIYKREKEKLQGELVSAQQQLAADYQAAKDKRKQTADDKIATAQAAADEAKARLDAMTELDPTGELRRLHQHHLRFEEWAEPEKVKPEKKKELPKPEALKDLSVAGTFNPFALRGMGLAGGLGAKVEKITDFLRQVEENTRDTAENTEEGAQFS